MNRRQFAIIVALGAGVVAWSANAQVANYPTGPIKIVVPFTPGSVSDLMARLAGQGLTARLGKPVVVENRDGASGVVGTSFASKAAPDGYTLLLGTITTHGTNSGVFAKLAYDPIKDLEPITQIAGTPNVLVVNAAGPVKTIADLVKLAKEKPGALNYGSAGLGSGPFLCIELLKMMAGADLKHIPYKGSPETLTALLSNEITVTATSLTTALPLIKAGQIRALAVTTKVRSPLVSDIPTVHETYPGYEFSSWTGLFAPAGTPADIVKKLYDEVGAGLKTPEVKSKVEEQGGYVVASSPVEFKTFVAGEVAKWPALMRQMGVEAK